MSSRRKPMRYAHSEGHTDVCYSDSGKNIITCGSDGDVRIWTDLADDDPSSQCVGEHAIAIAVQNDRFYVGTDNNNVQSYTFPGAERDGIISRFTAPVTHISTIKNGRLIASGSCDMEIHVKNTETSEYTVLSGHKAPILCVALDPKGKYLASSSCDGTVRLWNLKDNGHVLKTWNCVPTCNNFYTTKCLARVSWLPESGSFLAIPDGMGISGYERDTWDKVFSFTDDQVTHPFSIAAFSTCGLYLAASTSNGDICIWSVATKDLVSRSSHDRRYSICGLAWNPSGNGEIAYCDVTGQLGTVEDCIPSFSADHSEIEQPEHENNHDLDDSIKFNSFVDDDDDDDDENVFSVEKIRAEVSRSNNLDFENDLSNSGMEDVESRPASRLAPIVDLQSPFQPGSTPDHLQHRYLVWNSVGIVRCQNTESENSIDVEFTDTAIHHALHINNFLKHTMAALTDKALVLAAEAYEDVPSKVVCVLLNSWDGQKEWTMNLPEEEEALAVAAGQGWLAVATDTRNLRLFTIAGSQREMIALPGPVVSLAAQGKRLIVVYHNGLGIPGDQNLGYAVLNVCTNELAMSTTWQLLPLSPKTTLQWVGFSDEGSPLTVDSTGMMRLLSGKGYWLPICNTAAQCKGKSDHYFITGVSERYENIRCILCKGARYPPTTPKPLVTEIPFKLPLCEDTTDKSQLEEKFWLSRLVAPSLMEQSRFDSNYTSNKEDNEATIKQTIIKLFALSCRSGLQEQALELGGLMPSEQVVQLAIKYASKLSKNHLADKLREALISRDIYEDLDRYAQHTVVNSTPIRAYENSRLESDDDEYDHCASKTDAHPELNGHMSGSENLLLAARKQKTSEQIKPLLVLSGSRKNPFKKSVTNQSLDSSGLDLLSSSYSQLTSNKPTKQITTPDLVQRGAKSKQTKLSMNSNLPLNKKPAVTFIQWFSTKKTLLQEEFPNLGAAELTKLAMKRFKEEKEKKTLEPAAIEPEDSPVVEIKKRKLEGTIGDSEEQVDIKSTKITPQENSEGVNKVAKQDSQDEEPVKKMTKHDSQDEGLAKKMSKHDSHEQEGAAKLTSASKLMAFAFKKST